tara:strand:- start:304 stop:978 length:675 start_codon:yes stop_codon:yes gene_type:complete
MASDEIFSFNFEIFNIPIFNLELIDDVFSRPSFEEDDYGEDDVLSNEEWDTLTLAEEKRLDDLESNKISQSFAPMRDSRITWDELSKFADSNTPQIAKIARERIAEIEESMKEGGLNFLDIVDMKFERPTITEDIGGREFTRPIGGGGGGAPRRQLSYDDLIEAGYDVDDDLDYYAENFTSDQWQGIRLGYLNVRDEAILMWEDETGLDYNDFQRGMYDEEDDY